MIVTALPLYHIFALTACFLLGHARRRHVPADPQSARHSGLREGAAEVQGAHLPGGEHAVQRAAQPSGLRQARLLRAARSRSAAAWRCSARWPSAGCKATGVPLVEGYGLSETVADADLHPAATSTEFTGTIGLPVPSTEISIRDDDGNELPLGEPGEICARGPQVMAGYWQRPDETAQGDDQGRLLPHRRHRRDGREGAVKIVDRKKDMVLVSGFNVYPNEVEDVVAMHPGVLECAVIGVPDAASGEAVKALRGARRDPALTEDELKHFCRRAAHQLQAAEIHRVPRRAAEDAGRQDPAPCAARRIDEAEGGVAVSSRRRSRTRRSASGIHDHQRQSMDFGHRAVARLRLPGMTSSAHR